MYKIKSLNLMALSISLLISCAEKNIKTSQPISDNEQITEEKATNPGQLKIDQFVYQGSFRISSEEFGDSSINYAIGSLAYNVDNHSLFIAGHDTQKAIAEFSIPALLIENELTDLNFVATPIQNFKTILSNDAATNPESLDRITGLYYKDGQLIVNAEKWYDAAAANKDTTLVIRDASNIETSEIVRFYELQGGAQAAGYISDVPLIWQEEIGSTHITGWSNVYSIVSRYSVGPSMHSFDIMDILDTSVTFTETVSTTAIMNFPYVEGEYLALGAQEMSTGSSASALWNSLSVGVYGFIVPGTNTFAVIGSSAGIEGGIGYKIVQDDGNLCGGPCPAIATERYNYYWFFDMTDIVNATRTSEPRPYAYGKWSLPFDNDGRNRIIGASFDPVSKILYLALSNAAKTGTYDQPPLIQGYKIEN